MKHGVLGSFKNSSLKELKKSIKAKTKIEKQKRLEEKEHLFQEESIVEVFTITEEKEIPVVVEDVIEDIKEPEEDIIVVVEEDEETPDPEELSEILNDIYKFEEASKEVDFTITGTKEVIEELKEKPVKKRRRRKAKNKITVIS